MQTIWITGGSTGIGFAVARKFLNNNWCVVISSSNESKLEKATKKLKQKTNSDKIFSLVCDVTDYETVKKTVIK